MATALAAPAAAQADGYADDLDEGLREMAKADAGYRKAQTYYEGSPPEVFASPRLRAALMRTGVSFDLNFAKTPVDAVVDRLKITAVTSPDQAVQDRVAMIWQDSQFDLFETLSFRRACEFGDSYLLVLPDPDVPSGVRMYLNQARNMRLLYDDEDETTKRFAIKKWKEGGRQYATLYYADRFEKYVTANGRAGAERGDWVAYDDPADGGVWPVLNEYGEVPVYHLRTDFMYGVPVHKGAYGAQDIIHKLVIGHASSIDYHAMPQRYALLEEGVTPEDFAEGDEDEFAYSIDTGATANSDDGRAQLRSEAGSTWLLAGVKGMGEFAPGDPNVFIMPMHFYVQAMAQITTTPAHYFDTIGNTPSGESLKTMEAPFTKKVELFQLLFGWGVRDALRLAVQISLGVKGAQLAVHWAPCASTSDLQTWQIAKLKSDLGVPNDQILIEIGYSETQVAQWMERGAESLEQKIATVNAIGLAMQGVAIAIQFGLIDEQDAREMFAEMLGLPVAEGPLRLPADEGGAADEGADGDDAAGGAPADEGGNASYDDGP